MLNNLMFLFVVVFQLALMSCALKPPKEFFLCHRLDPDFKECLVRAMQSTIRAIASGNKELEIPDLNHLKVSSINIKGTGGPVDLSQQFSDCTIFGVPDGIYTDGETAFETNNCYIRFKYIKNETMACQYILSGKLLSLPINSHGHANITLTNATAWHNLTCSIYEKNDNEYLKIIDWVAKHNPEKIFFNFDNLVDGNTEMSAQLLQVINDNGLELYGNIKSSYEKSFAAIYKRLANKVFDKIPWKDIFPE